MSEESVSKRLNVLIVLVIFCGAMLAVLGLLSVQLGVVNFPAGKQYAGGACWIEVVTGGPGAGKFCMEGLTEKGKIKCTGATTGSTWSCVNDKCVETKVNCAANEKCVDKVEMGTVQYMDPTCVKPCELKTGSMKGEKYCIGKYVEGSTLKGMGDFKMEECDWDNDRKSMKIPACVNDKCVHQTVPCNTGQRCELTYLDYSTGGITGIYLSTHKAECVGMIPPSTVTTTTTMYMRPPTPPGGSSSTTIKTTGSTIKH